MEEEHKRRLVLLSMLFRIEQVYVCMRVVRKFSYEINRLKIALISEEAGHVILRGGNFPMNPHVCLLVGLLLVGLFGRCWVCHNFLGKGAGS